MIEKRRKRREGKRDEEKGSRSESIDRNQVPAKLSVLLAQLQSVQKLLQQQWERLLLPGLLIVLIRQRKELISTLYANHRLDHCKFLYLHSIRALFIPNNDNNNLLVLPHCSGCVWHSDASGSYEQSKLFLSSSSRSLLLSLLLPLFLLMQRLAPRFNSAAVSLLSFEIDK